MSARTPFVPFRPASRAAQSGDKINNDALEKGSLFVPDQNHPLNQKPSGNKENLPAPATNNAKQLNLSGLKKSTGNGGGTQIGGLGSRKSVDQRNTRPGGLESSAAKQGQDNIHGYIEIASPHPQIPGRPTPPLLSKSLFDGISSESAAFMPPPPVSSHRTGLSNPAQNPGNDAHISGALKTNFSLSNLDRSKVEPLEQPSNNGLPLDQSIHFSTSFEDHIFNASGFGSDTPFADQGGPRRILLGQASSTQDDLARSVPSLNNASGRVPFNQKRRSRADFDNELADGDYNADIKRAKYPDGNTHRSLSDSLRGASTATRHLQTDFRPSHTQNHQFSPQSLQDGVPEAQYRACSGEVSFSDLGQPLYRSRSPHQSASDPAAAFGALGKVFGRDADQYIEGYVEKYEAAKKRWTDCSMDDWVAGAEEISAKFTKILDAVKEHMAAKVKLFADMNAKIDAHNTVLGDRSRVLAEAREQLVQTSGSVLGR